MKVINEGELTRILITDSASGDIALCIAALTLIMFAITGYAKNIFKLFASARDDYKGIALRIVGIFVPVIGAVIGFIDIK